jgi:hypothetical protein
VWSFGVILYALLCGTLPFDEENFQRLFQKIKRGRYLQPSYLSYSSKDLIAGMLQTDPVKRITIADIRRHPWFLRHLPPYLFSVADPAKELGAIDERALRDAIRLSGYTREQICHALRKGRRNHFTSAYHLEKDAHDKLARLAMLRKLDGLEQGRPDESTDAGDSGTISPHHTTFILDGIHATTQISHLIGANETNAVPIPGRGEVPADAHHGQQSSSSSRDHDSRLPGASTAVQDGAVTVATERSSSEGNHNAEHGVANLTSRVHELEVMSQRPHRWTTGMRAPRTHPAELMARVYRTLHRLNWRWKTPSEKAFEVKVYVDRPGFTRPVRLRLQLFKTIASYTLDVHRTDGDMIAYFAVCTELLRELDF